MYKDSVVLEELGCKNEHTCELVSYYHERIEYLESMVKKYKYDYLTGLMGKLDFTDKFDRLFEEHQFGDQGFAIAIVDIDGLHNKNRLEGYVAGDNLIKKVANDLKKSFAFHQVYRISGDEFIVACRSDICSEENIAIKLEEIDDVSFIVRKAEGYTCPKHMFKSIDRELTEKKNNRKDVPERL